MAFGFVAHKKFESNAVNSETEFSIIVCARNESLNIEECLSSIIKQNYNISNYEIIFVNDASTDDTLKIAKEILKNSTCNYQIISNATRSGKKAAIKKAIELAKYNLIVTRDADTFSLTTNWLSTISDFYNHSKNEFIICPVVVKSQNNLLSVLQETESAVLTIFTTASVYHQVPFLCSGANLVFTKSIFYRTGAYKNHIQIESGDDVFFLEDVKKVDPGIITYLKNSNAAVLTTPQNTFYSLLQQKARWAGKLKHSKNPLNWLVALVVAGANALFAVCLVLAILNPKYRLFALIFVFSKLLIDILLVFLASRFVKIKASLILTLLAGFLYPFYALVVALGSVFIKPNWKL